MASIQVDDGTPSGFTPNPATPFAIWGDSGSSGAFGRGGNGVLGTSKFYTGVAGFSLARDFGAAGVFGSGPVGVTGFVTGAASIPGGPVGVYGSASNQRDLRGVGVLGEGDADAGVVGESRSGAGMSGLSTTGPGVRGVSPKSIGVVGISTDTGIVGWGGSLAGFFIGDVDVTGSLSKGGGGFKIDHPIDPKKKYLRHSFVESPDRKNLYDGIATCDAKGRATVQLPNWFEALNTDFRYQLTPVGAAAPGLFIGSGVKSGRFVIAGGKKGLKVSWQVTGTRRDPWAKTNKMLVEEKKVGAEKGKYLHADAHAAAQKQSITYAFDEEAAALLAPKAKKKSARRPGKY